MRACFLGQNVTALGNGFAKIQSQPPVADIPVDEAKPKVDEAKRKEPAPAPNNKNQPAEKTG